MVPAEGRRPRPDYPPLIFSLRISLPDLPGTLGRVATAFGTGGVNILTLDVIGREDGMAIDDLRVEAPTGMQEALRQAAKEVPGFTVEYVRPLEAFGHVLDPIELAARLSVAGAEAVAVLIEHLSDAFAASWAMALDVGDSLPVVLAAGLGAPSAARIPPDWLDFSDLVALPGEDEGPPRPRRTEGGLEVAAARLGPPSRAVLLGRENGPRFRTSELNHVRLLAGIAAAAVAAAREGAPI
ncbi:MAG TPA: ACT domain-containing protein [Actinomycetota bacterium]|nr:ACT domain-containing protein [Actinomycetota bacterium]